MDEFGRYEIIYLRSNLTLFRMVYILCAYRHITWMDKS